MCTRPVDALPCLPPNIAAAAGVDASADNESCTWVFKDPQGRLIREVEFSLGLNMPFMFASRVGERRFCSIFATLLVVFRERIGLQEGSRLPAADLPRSTRCCCGAAAQVYRP